MSGFLDRVFGTKVEVDLIRTELESRLSYENSLLAKELLMPYVSTGRTGELTGFLASILAVPSAEDTHDVTTEIKLFQEYIELIKKIKGNGFYMNLDVKNLETTCQIAPLILFPLVQNAVKNAYSSLEKYPIKVKVTGSETGIVLEVSNRVNHYVKNQGGDDIIRLYKQRLLMCYPDKHELLINSNSNTFKATLFLKY